MNITETPSDRNRRDTTDAALKEIPSFLFLQLS